VINSLNVDIYIGIWSNVQTSGHLFAI